MSDNSMPVSQSSWQGYWQLMRADKPIGTYLLLWPTLWGLWIASEGLPSWHHLFVFIAGVYLMRAAGCVINDYADRGFDGKVKRTSARPLVTGQVTEKGALTLFAALVFASFLLVLSLNIETILMSVVALILAASYPFMKRYTYMPQFVLGMAFSWGIPMSFTAVSGSVPWWGWALYITNLLWTVAYDTMYAMVDRDDDLQIGVKSTAILFGQNDKLIIGLLQVATLGILTLLIWHFSWGWSVMVAVAGSAILFAYEQWLIRNREREPCFKAFLHNNYVGMLIFIGIATQYWLV